MIKTTVKVDGMMCGMCESHVNDAVRKVFQVDKVTSSHSKGETVIISEKPVDEAKLKTAISATGYEVKGISSEPYEKKKVLFYEKKRSEIFSLLFNIFLAKYILK